MQKTLFKYFFAAAVGTFSILQTSFSSAEPQLPVLLARAAQSKVMLLIDDSGSMQASMVHPGYDVNDPLNSDQNYRIPMFVFRLNSGTLGPATNQTVRPLLMVLQRGYYDNRGNTAGNMWDASTTLVNIANHKAISMLRQSSTVNGINSTRLFGLPTNPAIVGGAVFNTANIVRSSGSPVTDSAGNEFFFFDVNCTGSTTYVDSMCSTNYPEDFRHTFVRFDGTGAVIANRSQRFYASQGGEIVFNGRTINLGPGVYEEKYIRWLFHFATPEQLAAIPRETRIEATRRIVRNIIVENPSIQFGLSTFNGTRAITSFGNFDLVDQFKHPLGRHQSGQFAVVRAMIGSDRATLLTIADTLGANGGTPPHAAFVEVMRYYDARGTNRNYYYGRDPRSGFDYVSSPITSECDNHFVVMLTDGLPNNDCRNRFNAGSGEQNIPNTDGIADLPYPTTTCTNGWEDYLDDASKLAHEFDFSPLPGTQSLTNFAVGLGLRFDLLDRFAEYGGSGAAYRADTVEELEEAFDDIVNSLITTPVSGAGVALAEAVGNDTRVFRPTFYQKTWRGTLDVFRLNDGNLEFQYDMGELLENRSVVATPRRVIAGSDPDGDGIADGTVDFSGANASVLRPQLFRRYLGATPEDPTDLADPIEAVDDDAAAETLIRYILGENVDDMRSRDFDADGNVEKLGDIIYSRPIEVGPVNGTFHNLEGYTEFTAANRSGPNLVVVGANDGMLHAFDADSGEELWAYVPSNLLPNLEYLSRMDYNLGWHRYFVDGLILAQDAWVNGKWKTLLIFGQREGGSAYTVLDVTDRRNPELLLEVSSTSVIGESWNLPSVVKTGGTTASTSGADFQWFLAVGSGEGRSNTGTQLVFVPLQSGTPSMITLPLETSSPIGTRTSSLLWINSDKDVNDDRGYVGTEDGDLFRIGVTGTNPAAWTVTKVFDGTADTPIVATPVAVLAENPIYVEGGSGASGLEYSILVSFGTGKYDETSDIAWSTTRAQRIVGIFDPVNPNNDTLVNAIGSTSLAQLQRQNAASYANRVTPAKKVTVPVGKRGFYVDLSTTVSVSSDNFIEPVGMVLHQPLVVRGAIVYSTFLPNTEECGLGGKSFLEAVDFRSGGGIIIDGLAERPINPRYAGGILDYDENGSVNEADLEYGLRNGMVELVMDAELDSVDLSDDVRPYRHDGQLGASDIRLHPTNGGILPSVSSLGNSGAPSPPVLSFVGEMIIVQNAFVVEPEFAAGTNGTNTQYNETPPTTEQFNIYAVPPRLLSFHEVVRE